MNGIRIVRGLGKFWGEGLTNRKGKNIRKAAVVN